MVFEGNRYNNRINHPTMHYLEKRRERVLKLTRIATKDGNAFKQAQGYYLLREINRKLETLYTPKM